MYVNIHTTYLHQTQFIYLPEDLLATTPTPPPAELAPGI